MVVIALRAELGRKVRIMTGDKHFFSKDYFVIILTK